MSLEQTNLKFGSCYKKTNLTACTNSINLKQSAHYYSIKGW